MIQKSLVRLEKIVGQVNGRQAVAEQFHCRGAARSGHACQ